MPLSDRDRRTLKWGGIIAGVLLLALLGIGQLGKGSQQALPPLSPVTGTPSAATGGPSVGPSGSPVSPTPGGPSPSRNAAKIILGLIAERRKGERSARA